MLNDKTLNKYNSLFTEVAEYYSLEEHIIKFPDTGTCIILSNDLGCGKEGLAGMPKKVVYDHLRKKYPSLLPFYKLFFTIRKDKVDLSACERYFNQINVIIKNIRNEYLPYGNTDAMELKLKELELRIELAEQEADITRKHAEATAEYEKSEEEKEREKIEILDKLMRPYRD